MSGANTSSTHLHSCHQQTSQMKITIDLRFEIMLHFVSFLNIFSKLCKNRIVQAQLHFNGCCFIDLNCNVLSGGLEYLFDKQKKMSIEFAGVDEISIKDVQLFIFAFGISFLPSF
jgi:hypothetical protein